MGEYEAVMLYPVVEGLNVGDWVHYEPVASARDWSREPTPFMRVCEADRGRKAEAVERITQLAAKFMDEARQRVNDGDPDVDTIPLLARGISRLADEHRAALSGTAPAGGRGCARHEVVHDGCADCATGGK